MVDALAVSEAELPAMPGTNQHAIFEGSFAERAALVWANAAHRRKGSANIGNADRDGAEQKLTGFAVRWKFRDRGDARLVVHFWNIAQKER